MNINVIPNTGLASFILDVAFSVNFIGFKKT